MLTKQYNGRTKILSDATEVTRDNVLTILDEALSVHTTNAMDIQYLWDYYRGIQPINGRVKEIRDEINNKVLENRAFEIVEFKNSYLMGEPIQYVLKSTDDKIEDIKILNGYVKDESKEVKDKKLAKWLHICGIAHRMVLPKQKIVKDESPFEIFTLDPRRTFVVFTNDISQKPLMGVTYYIDKNGIFHYSCYSRNQYFKIDNHEVVEMQSHYLGDVPIIEYELDYSRMGSFEVVESLLNTINTIQSNRVDDIEQFVQALMIFHNVEIDLEQFDELRKRGAITYRDIDNQMKGDITYLTATLNQSETQTLVSNIMKAVREITGMPSTSSGDTHDSSNNGAVVMKNGWQTAEARAKESELMFEESEMMFLRIVLRICQHANRLSLTTRDIDIHFTRRNYENILQKAQVLQMMTSDPKVHPKLAFEHCGLFVDPDTAYAMSEEYAKEQEAKALVSTEQTVDDQGGLDATKDYTRDAGVNTNPFEARKSGRTTNRTRASNSSRS